MFSSGMYHESSNNFKFLNFQYGDAEVKEHYFRIYDSNGDGLIDFKEFMMTYYLTHMGTPEQMFQKVNKCSTEE